MGKQSKERLNYEPQETINNDNHSLAPLLQQMILNGWGERTIPKIPSMCGLGASAGHEKRSCCRR